MINKRVDRLLTLNVFRPLVQKTRLDQTGRIPILMYHGIANRDETKIHPYYRIDTSPDIFLQHIKFLYKNNFCVISLRDVGKYLEIKNVKASRYVVLTFDDGYLDFYTHVYPVLRKYEFTATVFLPLKFIGAEKMGPEQRNYLSWRQIKELNCYGIHFGSHTFTHPQLKNCNKKEMQFEIIHSKHFLEDKLGSAIDCFSYPLAFPEEDQSFIEYLKMLLIQGGYNCGVTTRIGTVSNRDDIFFLKRLPINSCDDPFLFDAKLKGYYDWFHFIQRANKLLKSRMMVSKND